VLRAKFTRRNESTVVVDLHSMQLLNLFNDAVNGVVNHEVCYKIILYIMDCMYMQ
jgi:uncharacterized protein YkvS